MRLIDLDAKEPYLLDGRYSVGIPDNAPTVETDIKVVAKDAYEHGYVDGWKERFGEPNEKLTEKINEKLINEYISKVGCCDECFASVYCTVNGLRESRVPQDYCVKNIKRYFGDRANLAGSNKQKGGAE